MYASFSYLFFGILIPVVILAILVIVTFTQSKPECRQPIFKAAFGLAIGLLAGAVLMLIGFFITQARASSTILSPTNVATSPSVTTAPSQYYYY